MQLFSHYIEQQTKRYPEIINWKNHIISDGLCYSYRDTLYDIGTYPSKLHYHDYYELVIFEEGDIQYVCEGCIFYPKYADIILIPPGNFHMSAINSESTRYKRHVFYLYPSAFDKIDHSALTSFLEHEQDCDLLAFDSPQTVQAFMNLLVSLKKSLAENPSVLKRALGLSYIIQIFYSLNLNECHSKSEMDLFPEKALAIKRYIDDNFSQINSVSQVAEHFFYSREYISRLFRKYFDTTLADYIMKRRIAESQALMMQDVLMIDIAYRVGFSSLSSFIRAFRTVTDMAPSEYRKLRKEMFLKNESKK